MVNSFFTRLLLILALSVPLLAGCSSSCYKKRIGYDVQPTGDTVREGMVRSPEYRQAYSPV